MCTSFCTYEFSVPLGMYLGMELPDHMIILYLTFYWNAKLFSKVTVPFDDTTSRIWVLHFIHLSKLVYYVSFILVSFEEQKFKFQCSEICQVFLHVWYLLILEVFIYLLALNYSWFKWFRCIVKWFSHEHITEFFSGSFSQDTEYCSLYYMVGPCLNNFSLYSILLVSYY